MEVLLCKGYLILISLIETEVSCLNIFLIGSGQDGGIKEFSSMATDLAPPGLKDFLLPFFVSLGYRLSAGEGSLASVADLDPMDLQVVSAKKVGIRVRLVRCSDVGSILNRSRGGLLLFLLYIINGD